MAKAPQPRRLSLDLGDKSLSALFLRSDGRLESGDAPFDGAKARGLDAALAALPDELLHAPPSSPQIGLGESAPGLEVVLTTSRALAALKTPPRVALLVTEGFEDLLLLDGGDDLLARRSTAVIHPAELCPRDRCLGVPERLGADGSVVRPLTAEALGELRQRVVRLEVAAIAVMLLHGYQNDAHERTIAQALASLGVPISISSAVARVPNERRRAIATLLDASLRCCGDAELAALRRAGLSRVLRSDSAGDVAPARLASPLRHLHAATATGLRGAQRIAAAHGLSRFATVHLFGAAAAVALHDPELLGDSPREPGPDALTDPFFEVPTQELHILALPKEADVDASPEAVAAAIFPALEAITLDRGHDPAAYPLLGYGAVTAPLMTELGDRLQSASVRILPAPSHVVGYGALCAPLVVTRRELLSVEASSAQQTGQIAATLHTLTSRLREDLKQEGYVASSYLPGLEWLAELRYHGKEGHSLILLGLGDGSPAVSGETDLVVRFCAEHKRRYGFLLSECPVEIVALQVRVTLPVSTPSYSEFARLAEQQAAKT